MFRLLSKKRSADSMDSSGKGIGIFRSIPVRESTGDGNNFTDVRRCAIPVPRPHQQSELRANAIRFSNSQERHCEERSDEAIQLSVSRRQSWIASLRSQ